MPAQVSCVWGGVGNETSRTKGNAAGQEIVTRRLTIGSSLEKAAGGEGGGVSSEKSPLCAWALNYESTVRIMTLCQQRGCLCTVQRGNSITLCV